MKHLQIHGTVWALMAAAVILPGCGSNEQQGDATETSYANTMRAEAEARAKDPAWKPTHQQTAVINLAKPGTPLHSFCVDREGNVLACVGKDASTYAIEVYSPEAKLLKTLPTQIPPHVICVEKEGTILIGGGGRLQRIDAEGKVLVSGPTPEAAASSPSDEDLKELAKRSGNGPVEERVKVLKTSMNDRRMKVTGLAASGEDVFMASPSSKDYTYCVFRMDRQFKNPKLIVSKLGGCCGQMDIQSADGKVWIAHNGRHRVECHDRDGNLLSSFGREDRKAADGFGGCCEPKNVRLAGGEILCAESGPPVAIKRFTTEGKFLGVVALPSFSSGCVRTTVDLSPDGKRLYVLNEGAPAIHIFAASN